MPTKYFGRRGFLRNLPSAESDHVIDDFLMSIRSVLTEYIEEIKRQSPESISVEVRDFLRVHNSKRQKARRATES